MRKTLLCPALVVLVVAAAGFSAIQVRETQALRAELARTLAAGPLGGGEAVVHTEMAVVQVQPAIVVDLSGDVVYSGILEPERTVSVVPRIGGRLKQVLVDVGDRVTQGTVIARLEPDELEIQVRQARASVDLATANLERLRAGARPEERNQAGAVVDQARSNRDAAKLAYDRVKILFEEGIVSKHEMDRAKTQLEVATSQLVSAEQQLRMMIQGPKEQDIRAAEAQLAQARAVLDLATVQLGHAEVRAPISGRIAQRLADAGAMVGTASPIYVIADTDTVKVSIGVSETDVVRIKQGTVVSVTVDSMPGLGMSGTIRSVAPMADRQTRLFPVVVQVPNANGDLKPGMYATVRVGSGGNERSVMIPSAALMAEEGGHYVFKVIEGVAEKALVQTGVVRGDLVQVISGVDPGEAVVVQGHDVVRPGDHVAVRRQR